MICQIVPVNQCPEINRLCVLLCVYVCYLGCWSFHTFAVINHDSDYVNGLSEITGEKTYSKNMLLWVDATCML